MTLAVLEVGALLVNGRFVIESRLGQGGFGEVYLARQTSMGRPVAIKVLLPEVARDPSLVQRFKSEAEAAGRLSHPHVLPVHDFLLDEESGLWFLVMQYVPGGRTLREKTGKIHEPAEVASIISAVGGALDAAHAEGIIHRDVNPANVLMMNGEWPLLADFGIARLESGMKSRMTVTGTVVGTPAYMSPEQAMGQPVTPKSDQYSLAIIAYELLAGRPPFIGDSFSLIVQHANGTPPPITLFNPNVGGSVRAMVMQALSKDPDARFGSCLEFARALASAANWTPPAEMPRPPRGDDIRVPPTPPELMTTTRPERSSTGPSVEDAIRTPAPATQLGVPILEVDDQPIADQPVADQTVPEQQIADQPVANHQLADQEIADQPDLEQEVAEQEAPDRADAPRESPHTELLDTTLSQVQMPPATEETRRTGGPGIVSPSEPILVTRELTIGVPASSARDAGPKPAAVNAVGTRPEQEDSAPPGTNTGTATRLEATSPPPVVTPAPAVVEPAPPADRPPPVEAIPIGERGRGGGSPRLWLWATPVAVIVLAAAVLVALRLAPGPPIPPGPPTPTPVLTEVPETPQPPGPRGSVRIAASVEGANILVNGQPAGKTPRVLNLRPGKYDLTLQVPSYRDFTQSVEVSEGQQVTVRGNLEPLPNKDVLEITDQTLGRDAAVDNGGIVRVRAPTDTFQVSDVVNAVVYFKPTSAHVRDISYNVTHRWQIAGVDAPGVVNGTSRGPRDEDLLFTHACALAAQLDARGTNTPLTLEVLVDGETVARFTFRITGGSLANAPSDPVQACDRSKLPSLVVTLPDRLAAGDTL